MGPENFRYACLTLEFPGEKLLEIVDGVENSNLPTKRLSVNQIYLKKETFLEFYK